MRGRAARRCDRAPSLEEGALAFGEVGVSHGPVAQPSARLSLGALAVQDQPRDLLDQALAVARDRRQPTGVGVDRRAQLGRRHHPVDQPDPQRLLGVERPGREQDVLGARRPHQIGQPLDVAQAVGKPQPGRRDRETRVGCGEA